MARKSPIIGILGSGTMGSGIALTALLADLPVVLYDVAPDMLSVAGGYIKNHLEKKRKAINIKYLDLTSELEAVAGCNFVIEAAPEDLDLKVSLFTQLDLICPPPAILATNTSTLSVTAIAAASATPERVGGMHFFNPASVLPLVEVIQGARTSKATIDSLVQLAKTMGKTPVVASDTPGFIVNRVARPFYGEALRLLGEGAATHEQIDRIVRSGGFRMGPFELMDLIGIDINFTATRSVYEQTFHEPRYRPHQIQAQMVAQKALGRKSGRGFYEYSLENSRGKRQSTITRPDTLESVALIAPRAQSISLIPGKWGPGVSAAIQKSGLSIVDAGKGNPELIIVTLGREEGLIETLQKFEREFDSKLPILCQCVDVTLGEIGTWLSNPVRLAGFDSLFLHTKSPTGSESNIDEDLVATLTATTGTSPETREAAERFAASLGCSPVWIEDVPALVLPRIVACLANEAAFAAGEGVAAPETIDRAMQLGTNYPMGPLAWAKQIGFVQITAILDHLRAEYGEERYRTAPLLRRSARLE